MRYKINIDKTQKVCFMNESNGNIDYIWEVNFTMIVPNKCIIGSNYSANSDQLPDSPTNNDFEVLIAGLFEFPYPPEPME